MRRCKLLVAILVATCSAWVSVASAQLPKAVITGPKESRPGALVVLDATESTGVGRLWLLAVSPEETSFLPVESGLKCIFASPTAGSYTFVLVVSGTNSNGGPAVDMATHTVILRGPVPPPPEPPPDPPPPPPRPASVGAMILLESGTATAQQALMLNMLRRDQSLSPRVLILDPDSVDQDKRPDQHVAAAVKHLGGRSLPRVLFHNAEGSFVADEPLPASWEALQSLLVKGGLR